MRGALGLLGALLIVAPSIPYFKYVRGVETGGSQGQRYVVADESVWRHARTDLNDLRLYSSEGEIPYKLEIERARSENQQKECKILQPGTIAGKTQFLLDMSGIAEYNGVTLRLNASNFVAHAKVEGANDPRAARWATLGTTTVYDLSAERLGRNSALQIPLTTYRFLRVTIDKPITPSNVAGATAGTLFSESAAWRAVDAQVQQNQSGRDTSITFALGSNVPVERVFFDIDSAQPNFRRNVEVRDGAGQPIAAGDISRIHLRRLGQPLDVEHPWIDLDENTAGTLRVIVHNGDDPPLQITSVRLQQYERRIYFEASPSMRQPRLFYGDAQAPAPVYDYTQLFQRDPNAQQAQLAAEELNSAFTGRPDERPWSEKHPALLWIAILFAVLALGGLALKSLRTAQA